MKSSSMSRILEVAQVTPGHCMEAGITITLVRLNPRLATWADVAACSRGFAALGKAREPQGAAPSLLTATG